MSGLEWTPPKGRIDEGEDTMEAAFREAREEAGLEANMMTVYNDIQGSVGPNSKIWPNTEYEIYSVLEKWSNTKYQIVLFVPNYLNSSNSIRIV